MPLNQRYLIDPEYKKGLQDEKWLNSKMGDGRGLKDVLGFSDDAVVGFYEAACTLLEQQRYEDARDAFFFLSHLSPHVGAFWLGQARSEQLNGSPDEAIAYYMAALGLDQANLELYMECVRCCLAAYNFDSALTVLDNAIDYANQHPDNGNSTQLHDAAVEAKEWIIATYMQNNSDEGEAAA